MTAPFFSDLANGLPVDSRAIGNRRRIKNGHRKCGTWRSKRRYTLLRQHQEWECWTYFAISPCQRFVKIGRSKCPVWRIQDGADIRTFEKRHGLGLSVLVRAYPGAWELERQCHEMMAPDRVEGEWFHIRARFWVLLARLDRRFRKPALHNQHSSQAA